MSAEIEGLGDVVTGGLTAYAVDPDQPGNRSGGAPRCLNCGNFLSASYCSGCGQPVHIHRSVGGFLHDMMHGVLHFEGKLWYTLPLLFTRPGELTRRYINGERARFFSPLALFLFAVFLTFAVFSIMGTGIGGGGRNAMPTGDAATVQADALQDLDAAIDAQRARIAAAQATGELTAELERELRIQQAARATAARMMGRQIETGQDAGPAAPFTIATGNLAVDAMVTKIRDEPELMLYKLQSNAYKFAWAIIPLSAPILWLLFPFSRRFGLYDHLIFITYSLSFMLILLVVSRVAVWSGVSEDTAILALIVYPPVHMYWQLRGTYRTSRWGGAMRVLILALAALFILILFMAGLLALGALG